MVKGSAQIEKGDKRREAVYTFVKSFVAAHGYSPTYRQIGEAVGLRSPHTVHLHVHRLVAERRLSLVQGSPRSLTPIQSASIGEALEELRWIIRESDGVVGRWRDGGVMPWAEVLKLYAPALAEVLSVTS